MAEVLWTDPSQIRFKISPHNDLGSTASGDWDLERRHPLEAAVKHRSIAQRYVECWPWEETDLFKTVYSRRIGREPVRGCQTMRDLLRQYYERVDGMFEEMKANGFRVVGSGGRRYPLPRLLVGRDGEVFIGNQGNHRLAMARILGLKEIAGEVICRHRMCLNAA
jgi:hypothetical protein